MGTRRLEVNIVGDASSLSRAFGGVQRDMGKMEMAARKVGRGLAVIGTGAAVAGIAGLAAALHTGVDEMLAQDAASAQTAAAIKSTGGAAGVTKTQIEGMASALQKSTGMQDDAIQSAENLLLTFTNIKNSGPNKIFDQATTATLNLSTAFHKDLNSSAVLVGKALQDPIKGLTALSRVGVQFTAQQKEQIKTLVESGHTLEAQKIILGEINRETGGSARAFGDTTAGQVERAKRMWEDFSETLARKVLPVVLDVVDFIRRNMPAIERVTRTAFHGAQRAVAVTMAYYRANILPTIRAIVTGAKAWWSVYGKTVEKVFALVKTIVSANLKILAAVIKGGLALIRGDWGTAWASLKTVVSTWKDGVISVLKGMVGILFQLGADMGTALAKGILSAITSIPSQIASAIGVGGSPAPNLGKGGLTGKSGGGGGGNFSAQEFGRHASNPFHLAHVPVGSDTDLGRVTGSGDRADNKARRVAECRARRSTTNEDDIRQAGDRAFIAVRKGTIRKLRTRIDARRRSLIAKLKKYDIGARMKVSVPGPKYPEKRQAALDRRAAMKQAEEGIRAELETLAANWADLAAESADLGEQIAALNREDEAQAAAAAEEAKTKAEGDAAAAGQAANDQLDAAAAEAALTPGTADDLSAAQAIEAKANADLGAARASGDPARIADAARSVLAARQNREQIEATMANTDALAANTDAITQSFGGATTFGYQGQQYVIGSLAPPSSDRLTGMEVGV